MMDSTIFGDEIRLKPKIVESIIKNHLGLNQKIGARKLCLGTCSSDFFNQNHLMGKGRGRIYSLNSEDGKSFCAIQAQWKNKKEKVLDISRFCSAPGWTVQGGWSKLIKEVIKKESPKKIQTFIDKRYGSGKYLKDLGWEKKTEYLSFKWTKNKNSWHRKNFQTQDGYEKGFAKNWDCGQAKWELNLTK